MHGRYRAGGAAALLRTCPGSPGLLSAAGAAYILSWSVLVAIQPESTPSMRLLTAVMLVLPITLLVSQLPIPDATADEPRLPGIGAAMQAMIDAHEIAGAVTVVVDREHFRHLECTGLADVAAGRPMTPDTFFWIASMTKPVTGVAIMILADEGRLSLDDLVERHIPEFAELRTPSGKPARLTIRQILTHTSGVGEAAWQAAHDAKTLAELVPAWLTAPMQYEPGEKWVYTQAGLNLAGRIVEVISGQPFDTFLQKRLFDPLGMVDTTFYPTDTQRGRLATGYLRNKNTGQLDVAIPRREYGDRSRPPLGNGGLYSTPLDYARFCTMLLNRGLFDGQRILSQEAVGTLSAVQTGDLPTGFLQAEASGSHGQTYGWGVGTCVVKVPHDGVAAGLSAGTFGHGGAWGTQAWIDPVQHTATILMVQRANFPNSDGSIVRRAFQEAAAAALVTAAEQ